jgi:hypothetical protein
MRLPGKRDRHPHVTASLPGLFVAEAFPRRDKLRRLALEAISRLDHFFAYIVEPDNLGSFAVIKVAGHCVLDHSLQFLFRVRRRENRVP